VVSPSPVAPPAAPQARATHVRRHTHLTPAWVVSAPWIRGPPVPPGDHPTRS
jgi:hypothetical protein